MENNGIKSNKDFNTSETTYVPTPSPAALFKPNNMESLSNKELFLLDHQGVIMSYFPSRPLSEHQDALLECIEDGHEVGGSSLHQVDTPISMQNRY